VVRLQSLLEMALREGGGGANPPEGGVNAAARDGEEFKEDLKVTMASSGLYEWLIKVASVSGVIGQEGGDAVPVDAPAEKDDKEKKPLLGTSFLDLS
jgi:gamma-tubulin complex component 2